MDIKIEDKVVGNMYVNVQLPLENFENKSFSAVVELIRGSEGIDPLVFNIGFGDFKIVSFRRVYNDDEKVCVEGALLEKIA